MTKRVLTYCAAALLSAVALYGGCGGDVTGQDCKLKCDDAKNTCVQKCNDDQCKTKCTTELHDCSLKCDSITTATPKPDGG